MREEISGVLKAAPTSTYVGATLAGLSIPDWAAIAALVYSVTMLGFLLYDRLIKPRRRKR